MQEPIITWHVLHNDTEEQKDRHYAGSFVPGDKLNLSLRVWNNQWGDTKVKTVVNGKIIVYFSKLEDSYLLQYCSFVINKQLKRVQIINNKAYVELDTDLQGNIDDGYATDNYVDINIELGPITDGMEKSMKHLVVDLKYDTQDK